MLLRPSVETGCIDLFLCWSVCSSYLCECVSDAASPWCHIRWHRNVPEIAWGSVGRGKRIGSRLEPVIAVGLWLPALQSLTLSGTLHTGLTPPHPPTPQSQNWDAAHQHKGRHAGHTSGPDAPLGVSVSDRCHPPALIISQCVWYCLLMWWSSLPNEGSRCYRVPPGQGFVQSLSSDGAFFSPPMRVQYQELFSFSAPLSLWQIMFTFPAYFCFTVMQSEVLQILLIHYGNNTLSFWENG